MLALLLLIVYLATFTSIFATHYFLLSSIIGFAEREGKLPTAAELVMMPLGSLAIIVLVIFVVMTIIVIFISHRIAGPLHRLKQYMQSVGKGDFSVRLRFRTYDEIHDVADSFNEMVEGLRKLNK